MENVIDWSEQPKDFPLWLEGINEHRRHSGWYCRSGEVFRGAHGVQWRAVREGQFFTVHERPVSLEWAGEGLPPVGIEIEALLPGLGSTTYFWQRAKVVHGALPDSPGEVLVFSLETTRPAWVDEFRPVRTPEQIAAEEHRKAVEQLAADTDWILPKEACEAVLAAGYRKQVTP